MDLKQKKEPVMKRYAHKDHTEYLEAQIRKNEAKLHNISASTNVCDVVVKDVLSNIPEPSAGICHGVRNGWEVCYFREKLFKNVIGTEISPTGTQFDSVIQWDFHEVKDTWVNNIDFIYTNSWSHSYDPELAICRWMSCIKKNGRCYIEWSPSSNVPACNDAADCFSASLQEYRSIVENQGFVVLDVVYCGWSPGHNQAAAETQPRYVVIVGHMTNTFRPYTGIQKRAFAFWGNDLMSFPRYMTLASFTKLNPDWQIDLYVAQDNGIKKTWSGPEQQDFFRFNGVDYKNKIQELGVNVKPWSIQTPSGEDWSSKVPMSQQSNFFKWETLYKEGGVYIDMDILFTRPISDYYTQIKDKDLAICCARGYFSIGFLASRPGCRFYKELWENAFRCFNTASYQTAGVENIYNKLSRVSGCTDHGLYTQLWHILTTLYPECRAHNNEFSLVYPWPWDQMVKVWQKKYDDLPDQCIGIHWYAGTDISQTWNNLLTEDNIADYDNTFTYWARRLL